MTTKSFAESTQRLLIEANRVWVEIGLPEDKRVARLDAFCAEIERVLGDLLAKECKERDQIKERLCHKLEDLSATCEMLGETKITVVCGTRHRTFFCWRQNPFSKKLKKKNAHAQDIKDKPLLDADAMVGRKLFELLAEKSRRETRLHELLAQLHGLRDDLGDVPADATLDSTDDLRRAHFEAVERTIEALERIKSERTFEMAALVSAVRGLCDELGEAAPTAAFGEERAVSAQAMAEMHAAKDKLGLLRGERLTKLTQLRQAIATLYTKIGLPREELGAFLEASKVPRAACVAMCEAKLCELREAKRQGAQRMVEAQARRIEQLWDELNMPDVKRAMPAECASLRARLAAGAVPETDTDEAAVDRVLQVFEAEVERLENMLREIRPIVDAIQSREQMLVERAEFEAMTRDQTRLFQRDPGRLLREEKMRARFEKTLPKLETDLRKRLADWEEMHGEPFVYARRVYLEKMDEDEAHHKLEIEEERHRKEREKLEKKMAASGKTASAKTPAKNPAKRGAGLNCTLTMSDLGGTLGKRQRENEQPAQQPTASMASDSSEKRSKQQKTSSDGKPVLVQK
jgi:hypothetical protein